MSSPSPHESCLNTLGNILQTYGIENFLIMVEVALLRAARTCHETEIPRYIWAMSHVRAANNLLEETP